MVQEQEQQPGNMSSYSSIKQKIQISEQFLDRTNICPRQSTDSKALQTSPDWVESIDRVITSTRAAQSAESDILKSV